MKCQRGPPLTARTKPRRDLRKQALRHGFIVMTRHGLSAGIPRLSRRLKAVPFSSPENRESRDTAIPYPRPKRTEEAIRRYPGYRFSMRFGRVVVQWERRLSSDGGNRGNAGQGLSSPRTSSRISKMRGKWHWLKDWKGRCHHHPEPKSLHREHLPRTNPGRAPERRRSLSRSRAAEDDAVRAHPLAQRFTEPGGGLCELALELAALATGNLVAALLGGAVLGQTLLPVG